MTTRENIACYTTLGALINCGASNDFLTPNRKQLQEARERFSQLLGRQTEESEWQGLFKQHPYILSEALPVRIRPTDIVPMGRPGRSEPDFIFYPTLTGGSLPYGVIELKRPDTKILRFPRKNLITLSGDAQTALAQAKQYARDFERQLLYRTDGLIFLGTELHLFLIIGMSSELASVMTTEPLRAQFEDLLPKHCRLIPYDTLFELFDRSIPPQVHVLVPELFENIELFRGLSGSFTLLQLLQNDPSAAAETGRRVRRWLKNGIQGAGVTELARTRDVLLQMASQRAIDNVLDEKTRQQLRTSESEIPVRYTLQHGDLNANNVIIPDGQEPVLIDFARFGTAPATLDPITLELSTLFHPAMGQVLGDWPTAEAAAHWSEPETYLQQSPVAEFIKELRVWTNDASANPSQTALTAAAYILRYLGKQQEPTQVQRSLLDAILQEITF